MISFIKSFNCTEIPYRNSFSETCSFCGPYIRKVYNKLNTDDVDQLNLLEEIDEYNMKYKTYLKTRDPVYLQEIHNILSTKSSLTNNDDLNEIQISNMQHNVIGNNSKNLTMSSIDPKNFDHAVRNEIQTLLPYESFQYEDFVILQKACFRYELLNHHNNSLLFQTIYAPEKKYLTNEFLQNIKLKYR